MHRQRYRVFIEELGWRSLRVIGDFEADDYDDEHAVYILALDGSRLVGSLRLLPSWRRSLMQDKFAHFVDVETPVAPDIWEWTRWAPGDNATSPRRLVQSRALLIAGATEFAISRGAQRFTAVCDPKFVPQLDELGWRAIPLGFPTAFAEGTAMALAWDVCADDVSRLRKLFRLSRAAAIEAPAYVIGDEAPFGDLARDLSALTPPPQQRARALSSTTSALGRA